MAYFSNIYSILSVAVITPTRSILLNDTSIAATSAPNGNRHLFFQDYAGAIRHMIQYKNTELAKTWTMSLTSPLPSGAKLYTPLAASIVPFGEVIDLVMCFIAWILYWYDFWYSLSYFTLTKRIMSATFGSHYQIPPGFHHLSALLP